MKISLPDYISHILNKFVSSGYEAFVVGGCVRDSILGHAPSDWDITTNATPDMVSSLFAHTIPTGIAHGTVTVLVDEKNVEVTTYRTEGKYSDNRHPDSVNYTSSLREDLSRRDFTMNAIAYSPSTGIIDYFEGVQAIQDKMIICVGNSDERFKEDGLRMMRAIRFSAQLDFSLAPEVFEAICNNYKLLRNISIERIRDEFVKTLLSKHPGKINLYKRSNLLSIFLPELTQLPDDAFNGILHNLELSPNRLNVRLAMLFEKHTPTEVRHILRHLKFDNLTVNNVSSIIEFSDTDFTDDSCPVTLRIIASKIGQANLKDLISTWSTTNKFNDMQLTQIKSLFNKIESNKYCTSLKDLAINGNDLINIGISNGKKIGTILNYLFEKVLINPELNTRDALLTIVKQTF